MDKLGHQYGKQGLTILAINTMENKAGYQQFVEEHDYASLVWARDRRNKIGRIYQVQALPTTFVLDREGTIHSVHHDLDEDTKAEFAQEIESLLKQRDV